jgi:hypothetical protein
MVYFHSVSHVSNTSSITLELVGDEANFVATLNQALSELVTMGFDTSELWEGEVGANHD